MRRDRQPARERPDRRAGFALLVVLWSLALMALLGTAMSVAARSHLQVARNLQLAAEMEVAADGLVYRTIARLMSDNPRERGVDGVVRPAVANGLRATVRVTSLAGRINPNVVSTAVMGTLLQRAGLAPAAAARMADAVASWRTPGLAAVVTQAKAPQYQEAGLPYGPPGQPFESVGELAAVLGFTPGLVDRLGPHLTVAYPGEPERAAADPLVQGVLAAAGEGGAAPTAEGPEQQGVYAQIEAAVAAPGGASFLRRVTVWAGHGQRRGEYRVLDWDAPP